MAVVVFVSDISSIGLVDISVYPVDFGGPDSHKKLVMGSSMTVIPQKISLKKNLISA